MSHSATPRPRARPRALLLRQALCAMALALAAPLSVVPLAAQDAAPALHLDDVYRELRARSPRLVAATALATAARARVPGAGVPPDPQVQLGWMNYELPSLRPMEPTGMTQLQVMQMLPLGGKLGLSRGIAASRASAQEERAGEAWWEARAQAAMLYHDLHQVDARLVVMRETLRLLDDIRRTAESMYRVGEGRQADVLRAQVEAARMTEDTLRMHAMRRGMAARLEAALDRPAGSGIGPTILAEFPAELPSLDALQQAAVESRPMLRAAGDEVDAAEQMQQLARRELFPDLQVGVQYGQRRATMTTLDDMGEPMVERRTERMASLMIGASIPVFARSRQLRMREEAEAMRQMAVADLAAMRADTRGAVATTYADLERARRLAALYRTTILPQAAATVASAQSAYRVGQVDFMTLLDNQMTVNKYRQELAVLDAEQGKAWAELEMLVGRELLVPATTITAGATAPATGGTP